MERKDGEEASISYEQFYIGRAASNYKLIRLAGFKDDKCTQAIDLKGVKSKYIFDWGRCYKRSATQYQIIKKLPKKVDKVDSSSFYIKTTLYSVALALAATVF